MLIHNRKIAKGVGLESVRWFLFATAKYVSVVHFSHQEK